MKQLFTLCLFLAITFLLKAGDITVSSVVTWTAPGGLAVSSGDKITIASGGELTINLSTAPDVNIKIQNGGKCFVNSFNATGTITVESGGIFEIVPIDNNDIIIGHDITFEAFSFPTLLNDGSVMQLITLLTPTPSYLNIENNGVNYPVIRFTGSLDLNAGTIFNIKYPEDKTNKLEFEDINLYAIAIPTEFVPLLKSMLSSYPEYVAYGHLLDPGIIPPVIIYDPDAQFPVVNTITAYLDVLEISINFSSSLCPFAALFGLAFGSTYRQVADYLGIPTNNTYLTTTIDLGAYSRQAPASYNADIPVIIEVPASTTYEIVFPQLTTTTDKTWWLFDGEVKQKNLSSINAVDRIYSVLLTTGTTGSRFSFRREQITTSLPDMDVANEVLSIEYFTISGQRVQAPQNGVYIMKTIYVGGQSEAKKVFLKNK